MKYSAQSLLPVTLLFCLTVVISFIDGLSSAEAKFSRSDDHLYIDWLDLAVNPDPNLEFGVYAIVQTGGENLPVTYVIFSSFKGKFQVHGAARCDKEFTLQNSQTNGFYDIRCIKQDVFGQKTVSTLSWDGNGRYVQKF